MKLVRFAFAAALVMAPLPALAQSAQPATQAKPAAPPKTDAPAKADSPAKPDASTSPTKKEKKPRSEAQKRNDEKMRECGKEWRAAKAANKTDGKTWRQFSTECRRKKKTGG